MKNQGSQLDEIRGSQLDKKWRLKWMKFWRRQLDENKVEIRVKMDEIQGENG